MWVYSLLILIGNCVIVIGQINKVCSQGNLQNSIEVHCSAIPSKEEWEKFDYSTTIQTITCKQPDKSDSLSDINIKNLQRLAYFYISNCNITDLPLNFFENLIKLQSVNLDNLPIENLEENVFKNSTNLVELFMVRLGKLKKIHPRFLGDQNQLESLTLIESNIDPVQLRPILLTIFNTLTNLYWRRNRRKVLFSKNYFQHFQFKILVLEYNGINNVEFLKHVSTRKLSLKGNPIGKLELDWKNYRELAKILTVLDLSETGVDLRPGMILPKLEELTLSNNDIEQLPCKIEYFLPSLKLLDLRNNKLTSLPSLDYMLRIKFGQVYLFGNIFNCNCEMIWITIFNSNQIKDLKCENINIKKVVNYSVLQSKMTCTAPKLKLELHDQFKTYDYTMTINETIQVYRLNIYPDEMISWRCIGEGDPAPKLKWIKNQQTLKVEDPPINKHEKKTIMNNLIFPEKNFNKTEDYEIYICRAKSILGSSEIQIEVSKKYERRQTPVFEQNPVLGQIYQKNFSIENFKSSIFNLLILLSVYFFMK